MSRVEIQFLDEGLHRVLFDAMPMPVFLVDKDVNVLECNKAAARLFGAAEPVARPRRAGDVLHCLNAAEKADACGHMPACVNCQLRESVRTAARGETVTRRWAEMDLLQEGRPARVSIRVSCQPFTYRKSSFILLVLEGLN